MTENSEHLARRFFQEVWNERRIASVAELVHPNGVAFHTSGTIMTVEDFRITVHKRFLDAFPDLAIEIEDVLAADDRAAVRWCASGTHTGDGFGIKATDQKVQFVGTTWFTFRDGKILEAWDCWDHGGLLQSLWRHAPPDTDGPTT